MLGIELNAIRSASASGCCCVTEARAAVRFGILLRTELIWWFPMSMKVLAFVFVQDPQLNAYASAPHKVFVYMDYTSHLLFARKVMEVLFGSAIAAVFGAGARLGGKLLTELGGRVDFIFLLAIECTI